MGIFLTSDQFILVTILIKIGVMASIASLLVRSPSFKRILFVQGRHRKADIQFSVLLGVLLSIGVMMRLVVQYKATDLSLSGALLVALLRGPIPGLAVGTMISIPALLVGEWLALPMGLLYGIVGGTIQRLCPGKEEVWNFSPFPFMNSYRFVKTWRRERRVDWKVVFFLAAISLEALRIFISRRFGQEMLFSLSPESTWVEIVTLFSTSSCLGVPLKIWNNTRVEILLEKEHSLVLQARLDALRRQINPHFLFNALNSISSSIRTDPERARQLIVKLSDILRRLLGTEEDFVPLQQELSFIDAYLDIEVARFGEDTLRIERELDPRTLTVRVPAMVLQPIVENAIRHGLLPKVGGGTIRISTMQRDGETVITVEDDGIGIPEGKMGMLFEQGIGIRNVNERLKAAYGPSHQLHIESIPGEGVRAEIVIPSEVPRR
jgi:two-component system LytT family sensor kinase